MKLPELQFLRGFSLSLAVASSAFGQSYTISTFAGGGLPVNIPGTSASAGSVVGVAVDASGNLFLATQPVSFPKGQAGDIVLRLDAKSGILTLFAGNGTTGFNGDGSPATSAQLNTPLGVAVDSAGNVYIADTQNNRIREVSSGVINTVAGNGTSVSAATMARLRPPS